MVHPVALEPGMELTADDIETLETDEGERPTSVVPHVQRIRDSHHNIAKCLVLGMPDSKVAAKTGYSISRIDALKVDPSFQELLAAYRAEFHKIGTEVIHDLIDVPLAIYNKSNRLLYDHLEDVEEGIVPRDPRELERLTKLFGYGTGAMMKRTVATNNVNVNLADTLAAERLMAISQARREPPMLTVVEAAPPSSESSSAPEVAPSVEGQTKPTEP
jgi:hypothetical protein